jgi:UMP-CMP kinase
VTESVGGPGTGKGTQCDLICKNWDFAHLSAGDLLRCEQARKGSQYGALIAKYIQEGEIVPLEITIGLLQNKMKEYVEEGKPCFLIDGFPRKMDQAEAFQANVSSPFLTRRSDVG